MAINGHSLRDVIDVRYHASEPRLRLQMRRAGEIVVCEGERQYGEPLGLVFDEPIFDQVRRCNNRCEFCFVAQMPQGLRPSLYVKDDDYRLSFLFGSYVTLTNLIETDWKRIEEQHLSPLYVSVHATEADLRRRFLGNGEAPDVLVQLRRLAALDIEAHTQIVVRPGFNDRRHLSRSIEDLAALYPSVRSVSIVPLGLTKYHRYSCRLHTEAEMRKVLEQVSDHQMQAQDCLGINFAYLSDEWYLRLGIEVPGVAHYDGLDLRENGVGLVRHFLDVERPNLMSLISKSKTDSRILVTGTLFSPVLRATVAGAHAEVVSVANRFFGNSVTVSGLLTVRDVVTALRGRDGDGPVVLPRVMFNGPEGQSLDEKWPADVEQMLGRCVIVGVESR